MFRYWRQSLLLIPNVADYNHTYKYRTSFISSIEVDSVEGNIGVVGLEFGFKAFISRKDRSIRGIS